MSKTLRVLGTTIIAVSLVFTSLVDAQMGQPGTAKKVLKFWSHWGAEEKSKIEVFREAIRRYEKANPDVEVRWVWYHKSMLKSAVASFIPMGIGPDLFYIDQEWTDFIEEGLLANLEDRINWDNVQPWAKEIWTFPEGIFGLQVEYWTSDLYYNKDIFKKLGIATPENNQFYTDDMKEIVEKCRTAGYEAFSCGIANSDYTGLFMGQELWLHKLGKENTEKLYNNELSWEDPRIVEVLNYWKELVDMRAYPANISEMKLAESYLYFYVDQKAAMFPMGAFYPTKAFMPPKDGGQPKKFKLGMMLYPAWKDGKGNNLSSLFPAAALGVSKASKYKEEVDELLAYFTNPKIGALWVGKTALPTNIKVDPKKTKSTYKWYLEMYDSVHTKSDYFIGIPSSQYTGKMRETVLQILNSAFPAGLISVEDAIKRLESTRLSNHL